MIQGLYFYPSHSSIFFLYFLSFPSRPYNGKIFWAFSVLSSADVSMHMLIQHTSFLLIPKCTTTSVFLNKNTQNYPDKKYWYVYILGKNFSCREMHFFPEKFCISSKNCWNSELQFYQSFYPWCVGQERKEFVSD